MTALPLPATIRLAPEDEAALTELYRRGTPANTLRAGFLTQAALDGAPLDAAMKLSLHRSVLQTLRCYADVEISENPATDLLGKLQP